MKWLRWIVGRIILFIDWVLPPKTLTRTTQEQTQLALIAQQFSLYQLSACPFCVKVRRHMKHIGLPIVTKNVPLHSDERKELIEKGGKMQVPCLQIRHTDRTEWLYESKAIIDYLDQIAAQPLLKTDPIKN